MMRRLALTAALLLPALPAFAEPRLPLAGHSTPVFTMRTCPAGFAVPQAGYGVIFATRAPGSGCFWG